MSILTNPVTVSVIVLCVLSLLKLNVLLAMLVACIAGGLAGGIPIYAESGDSVMSLLLLTSCSAPSLRRSQRPALPTSSPRS